MKLNKMKLAVAGAVLASASVANAGIIIPAGEWTVDLSGNVNSYAVWTKAESRNTVAGGVTALAEGGTNTHANITTGLLPNFLSLGATTRQNDLDVSWLISIQPGSSTTGGAGVGTLNTRQAYLTFGDKSWGTIKVGKDLGIFASDAILSDMTLLGVGVPSTAGGNTTYGRIGAGYLYADWKSQIAYTTPNFNGFQATVGLTQNWGAGRLTGTKNAASTTSTANVTSATASVYAVTTTTTAATFYSAASSNRASQTAYEGKASYSFAANDVTGKVWVSGIANKVSDLGAGVTVSDGVAYAGDIGATVNAGGFGVTGYYYAGQGIGTTVQMLDGYATNGNARDSYGGMVQATYVLPTKTKVGISWGTSRLDQAAGETTATGAAVALASGLVVKENEMWTGGIYHPLTKHLNVVAEYSHVNSENHAGQENKNDTGSLGAILFF